MCQATGTRREPNNKVSKTLSTDQNAIQMTGELHGR